MDPAAQITAGTGRLRRNKKSQDAPYQPALAGYEENQLITAGFTTNKPALVGYH
jgi:hypothetical protein